MLYIEAIVILMKFIKFQLNWRSHALTAGVQAMVCSCAKQMLGFTLSCGCIVVRFCAAGYNNVLRQLFTSTHTLAATHGHLLT
jgi:hypothetical protein